MLVDVVSFCLLSFMVLDDGDGSLVMDVVDVSSFIFVEDIE